MIKIKTAQNIDVDYELAGIGDRTLARAVDYAIFLIAYIACMMVIGILSLQATESGRFSGSNAYLIPIIVWLALCVLYDLVCEVFLNGQSIGKRSAKIRVVSINGARPTIGQYLLRWIFRVLDFGITFGACAIVSVAVSKNRQRVGDMVAGTAVVKLPTELKFNNLVFAPITEEYETQYAAASQLTDEDVVLIYDVIKNFNRTRNSELVYRLAVKIKRHLNITTPDTINEYQFLEIMVQDYKHLTAGGRSILV